MQHENTTLRPETRPLAGLRLKSLTAKRIRNLAASLLELGEADSTKDALAVAMRHFCLPSAVVDAFADGRLEAPTGQLGLSCSLETWRDALQAKGMTRSVGFEVLELAILLRAGAPDMGEDCAFLAAKSMLLPGYISLSARRSISCAMS